MPVGQPAGGCAAGGGGQRLGLAAQRAQGTAKLFTEPPAS